ncbi:MAG TPA: acetolactate synthase [Candidatus Dormibacteraeota bacterium]
MGESAGTGELIALALQRAGTRHLFTLNGGHIWGVLLGALEHGIGLIDVRHEQTAAFAAEGWSKLTRECGVAAVTAGPGVTNTVSAIAGAWANDSPMLLIGGRSPLSTEGMGSLQELDHLPILGSITKSAVTVREADEVYAEVERALSTALTPRTGPAYLDVPADVFFSGAEVPAPDGVHLPTDAVQGPDPEQVARAGDLLNRAQRPVIVAGSGVWWGRAEDELANVAEAAGIPAVLNGLARGVLGPDHALQATAGRRVALGQADVVAVCGVPLDFRLGFGNPPVIAADAQLIYIDVDDRRRHRAGAAALDGDIRRSLALLAERVEPCGRTEWIERVRIASEESRRRDQELAGSNKTPIHPGRLVAEIRARLDPDAIVIGDGGDFVSFVGRMIESSRPGCFLEPGPYGCLGTGAGYAIAARLAHPDRQVVLFSGDGAFGFSAIDFDTLVRHRLPVVCVIGNNGIWATEKHPMEEMLGAAVAADLRAGTRYDLVAEALGAHGELVEDPEQLGPAFERALKAGVPAVINVLTDPTAKYPRSAVLL